MGAELDDLAVVDDGDAVGAHRGGEAVGDEDGGAALEQHVERLLDLRLGLEVEVRRGLVEHEDARAGEERPGQGEELPLAGRQRHAALVHGRVEPVGQPVDQVAEPDEPAGLEHLGLGRVGPGEADVLADRAGEQERLLRHGAHLPPHRARA